MLLGRGHPRTRVRRAVAASKRPGVFAWPTIRPRITFAMTRSLVLFCFAHGPPITRLHVPSHARRNLRALGPDLPGVDAHPLVASPFLQSDGVRARGPAAKTARPLPTLPSPVGCSSRARVSTTHAPSRRLQRVRYRARVASPGTLLTRNIVPRIDRLAPAGGLVFRIRW